MDLVSEVGELGKEIIKGSDYGSKEYETTEDTRIELGDVLFSLLALSSDIGVDANMALELALEKYEKRFEEKGKISSEL